MSILKQKHHGVRCVYLRIIGNGIRERNIEYGL